MSSSGALTNKPAVVPQRRWLALPSGSELVFAAQMGATEASLWQREKGSYLIRNDRVASENHTKNRLS